MKDKSVSQAIIDFANSRDPEIVKHFKYSAEPDEIFTVTITRSKTNLLSKHASWKRSRILFPLFHLDLSVGAAAVLVGRAKQI